jgi:NDP-sugar pyrophosphorylase family protein
VVLAGGQGSRLWPLTRHTPKPMVEIDDRPIMEFVVSALRANGFRRVLVILQFNPGPIVRHFGDGGRFGLTIDYVLQEGDVGTAGSVHQALDLVEEEEFAVLASDILFHGDLQAGEEYHRSRKAWATIALSEVDDPSEFGAVDLGPDGRIRRFCEKPPPGSALTKVVNAGIYFLDRRVLDRVPDDRGMDFGHELIPALVDDGAPVFGWRLPGYWRDIGTFDGLAAARRDIREIPALREIMTQWPASRSGGGGRIWIRKKGPAREWLEMDTTTIGHAAGLIWKYLSENSGKSKNPTLAELQKLKGIGKDDALAAIGWLAREGKLLFKQEGRTTRVQLTPSELPATVR